MIIILIPRCCNPGDSKEQDTSASTDSSYTETGTPNAEEQKIINPPFPELDIQFSTYPVDAAKGGMIKHFTGSTINFPQDAFLIMDGKKVTGEVDILYREFKDPIDFFVSGIPMSYDSAGVTYDFSSAGMLEINAFQNGEQLLLADNKKVDINMQTPVPEGVFNVYTLDTVSGQWVNRGKDKILKRKVKTAKQAQGKDTITVEQGFLEFNDDSSYAMFDGLVGKVHRTDKKIKTGQAEESEAAKMTAAREKAMYDKLKNAPVSADASKQEKHKAQKAVYETLARSFSIDGFGLGIVNCDLPAVRPFEAQVLGMFKDANGNELTTGPNYLVQVGNFRLGTSNAMSDVGYNPNLTNLIWTVLDDGRLGYITNDQIQNHGGKGTMPTLNILPPAEGLKKIREIAGF